MNLCQPLSHRCSSCEDMWHYLFCSFFHRDHRGKTLSLPRDCNSYSESTFQSPSPCWDDGIRSFQPSHVCFRLPQLTKLISVGNTMSWWGRLFWPGFFFICCTKLLIHFLLITTSYGDCLVLFLLELFSHLSSFSGLLFGKGEMKEGCSRKRLKAHPSCRMAGNGYCVCSPIFDLNTAQFYLSQIFGFFPNSPSKGNFKKLLFN